jgi:MFS family permease
LIIRHTLAVTTGQSRASYRDVLADREFLALFVADALSVFGDQIARLAVALLVYNRTGSAFAASATYACSYLTWLIGGPLLSVAADRYPRKSLMIAGDLGRLVLVLALCLPGLPLLAFFAVLALVGLLTPPFEAARSALIADILTGEMYAAANGLTQALNQLGQVFGFVLGGLLVAGLGPRGALLVDAATFALSAALLVAGVRARPAAEPSAHSFLQDTAAGVSLVFRTPELRRLLALAAVTMAVLIGPEGLAVPVAAADGRGAVAAGILTAAVPAGFVVGAWLLLRVDLARRRALMPGLALLACVPLLFTPLVDPIWAVAALWLLAGVGGSLQVFANAAFVAAVPPGLRGRAYGVASTCLMVVQGAALLAVGGLAEPLGPRTPIALMAALVMLTLPWLTEPRGKHSQGMPESGRRAQG